VMVIVPVCFFGALGVKVTEIVQEEAAARLAGQSLVCINTPEPVSEIISITTGAPECFLLPLGLDTFTVFALLVVPIAVFGNLSDFGLISSVTDTGVGVAVGVAVAVSVDVAVAVAVAVIVAVAVGVPLVDVAVAVGVAVIVAVAVAVGVAVGVPAVDVAVAVAVAVAVGVPLVEVAVAVGVAVAVPVEVAVAVAVAVALAVAVDIGVALAVGIAVAVAVAVTPDAGSPTTPWIRVPSGQPSMDAPSNDTSQLLAPGLNSSTSVGVKSVPPIEPYSSNTVNRCPLGSIEAPSRFTPSEMPAAALLKTSP
jgi:hypothetical protein